ncbi:MAG TPA: hypothetical protein VF600_01130 [Abditibacteriaceae bacterium]
MITRHYGFASRLRWACDGAAPNASLLRCGSRCAAMRSAGEVQANDTNANDKRRLLSTQ